MGKYAAALVFIAGASQAITLTVYPGDSIQDSLETLSPGDSLYLSPGTYTDPSGEPLLVCPAVLGGVSIVSDPLNRAVLDGGGMERSVVTLSGPNTQPFLLANLEITGGNATAGEFFNGGGIFCGEASAVITNCVISGNEAIIGGGIGAEGGTLQVNYTELTGNQALVTGGGIDMYACDFTGFMLWFEDNQSSDDGGGLNGYQSSVQLANSVFTGNYSGDDGGGICILQGTSSLEYLTVNGNEAFDDGGGLRIHTIDSLTLSSSIVTSNLGKAGINVISDNKPVMASVCCWNNEYSNYNGMEDPTGTGGNISQDPLFADDMFDLSQTQAGQPLNSPCLDAGHEAVNASSISGLSTRTDSIPDQGVSDMGFHHLNMDQTGIESGEEAEALLRVTPSPVTGVSTLSIGCVGASVVEFDLYDLSGRILVSTSVPVDGNGNASLTLSPWQFPPGTVLIRARWETGAALGRTVVLR